MRKTKAFSRRRGLSGIIGAVIFFALLFTTGLTYFLFVVQNEQLYTSSLVNRANDIQDRLFESLLVTGMLKGSNVGFTANNTGGIATTVLRVFVIDSSGILTNTTTNPTIMLR